MKITHLDTRKCPSQGGVSLTGVRLIVVVLSRIDLKSAGTCESVRIRKVSVSWDVRHKRFYCIERKYLHDNQGQIELCLLRKSLVCPFKS